MMSHELRIDFALTQLIGSFPGALTVFEREGFDYASHPGESLVDACERLGCDAQSMLTGIKHAPDVTLPDYFLGVDGADLPAMIGAIVETYHRPHRTLFRQIERQLMQASVEDTGWAELCRTTLGLVEELQVHMMKEEQVLFPLMLARIEGREFSGGCGASMSPQAPMMVMEMDHVKAGSALTDIWRLSEELSSETPQIEELKSSLRELWIQVNRHMYLENNVLFPAFRQQMAS